MEQKNTNNTVENGNENNSSGMIPEMNGGMNGGMNASMGQGVNPDMNGGINVSMGQGVNPNMQQKMPVNMQPMPMYNQMPYYNNQSMNPGMGQGMNPGMNGGMNAGMVQGVNPNMQQKMPVNMQPMPMYNQMPYYNNQSMNPGMNDTMAANMQRKMNTNLQNGLQFGTLGGGKSHQGYIPSGNGTSNGISNKNSIETSIGKNLMGIIASLLIFAGICLLATAVNAVIGDAGKIAMIMIMSSALFISGRIGMKYKKNAFFYSLAGCGIGAIFISIFLLYNYFAVISLPVMYVITAVWAIAVCFLGGEKATLFRIISKCGVLVSMLFGMVNIFVEYADYDISNDAFSLVLVIFYVALSVFYLIIERKSSASERLTSLSFDALGLILLNVVALAGWNNDAMQIVYVAVISIYALALVVAYVMLERVCDKEVISVFMLVYALFISVVEVLTAASAIISNWVPESDDANFFSWIMIVYCIALWIIINVIRKKEDYVECVINVAIILVITIFSSSAYPSVYNIMGCGIYLIALLVVSIIKSRKDYYTFCLAFFAFFCLRISKYVAAYIIIGAVILAVLYAVIIFRKGICSEVNKNFLLCNTYFMAIMTFANIGKARILDKDMSYIYCAMTICVVTILFTLLPYRRDWFSENHGEKKSSTEKFIYAANIINILYLMICIKLDFISAAEHIILSILLLFAAGMNVYPLLNIKEKRYKVFYEVYNMIKITFTILIILGSYDATSYVKSLGFLIIALTAIILGFVFRRKGIRLYGLILSIMAIAKLVLFDIDYKSDMLSMAITVLLCGVVAFGICFVYNILDKKIAEADAENAMSVNMAAGGGYATMNLNTASQVGNISTINNVIENANNGPAANTTVTGTENIVSNTQSDVLSDDANQFDDKNKCGNDVADNTDNGIDNQ